MIMAEKRNDKCWNTPDFESRFREAMGRDMTPEEREYFGLTTEGSLETEGSMEEERSSNESTDEDPPPDRTEFGWQPLRRLSALLG